VIERRGMPVPQRRYPALGPERWVYALARQAACRRRGGGRIAQGDVAAAADEPQADDDPAEPSGDEKSADMALEDGRDFTIGH
jgi:hypothetical protein